MRKSTLCIAMSGIAFAQAQTFTLSACTTQGSVVNCLRQGTTIPWTTFTSQASATATPEITQTSTAESGAIPTAITGCHMHGSAQFCFAGTAEYEVPAAATRTGELPSQYTGCHSHGEEMFCMDDTGADVEIIAEGASHSEAGHSGVTSPAVTSAAATPTAPVTALTGCHMHETAQFCMAGGAEYLIKTPATATGELPSQYTGCHNHGPELFCLTPDGGEVLAENQALEVSDAHGESSGSSSSAEGVSCHFHAGVEHCVNADGSDAVSSCAAADRDYNVPLRIGLIFVLLATSAIGVFAPILLASVSGFNKRGYVMTILKQFGTGVIISTALVHLYTHAELMFASECLKGVKYEGITAAIVMAGIILSFLPEYIGARIVLSRMSKAATSTEPTVEKSHNNPKSPESGEGVDSTSNGSVKDVQEQSSGLEKLKVNIMEAGVVFHSLLIGLTMVVAGDSFFKTLFVVVIFHQMFEGLALGCRIGELKIRLVEKIIMAAIFSVITPLGMAIGIGVLNQFNGNDPSTIIAIGTLDSLSAGILLWVGLVEMLAHDWLYGELAKAPMKQVIPAGVSLVAGLILMSLLGKWA